MDGRGSCGLFGFSRCTNFSLIPRMAHVKSATSTAALRTAPIPIPAFAAGLKAADDEDEDEVEEVAAEAAAVEEVVLGVVEVASVLEDEIEVARGSRTWGPGA